MLLPRFANGVKVLLLVSVRPLRVCLAPATAQTPLLASSTDAPCVIPNSSAKVFLTLVHLVGRRIRRTVRRCLVARGLTGTALAQTSQTPLTARAPLEAILLYVTQVRCVNSVK